MSRAMATEDATRGHRPEDTGAGSEQRPLPSRETYEKVLAKMLLIRRFEERAGEMYAKAKIGGFLHLCIGEEATIVGATQALRDTDFLMSTYREHGQALARGTEPKVGDGRAVREGRRLLGRARRLHAPVRLRAPLPRRLRDRGREPAARGRRGPGQRLLRHRGRDAVHVRRRRHQPGHLRGDDEPGRAVGAADRVHGHQQPVRHGHRAGAPLRGDRPVAQGRRLRRARKAVRRHGRARRARLRVGRARDGARGGRAAAGGGRDLPLPRALDGRPRGVPHQGGGGGVAHAATRSRPSPSA